MVVCETSPCCRAYNELGNSCKYFFDPMNVAWDTTPQSCLFLRDLLPYLPMRDRQFSQLGGAVSRATFIGSKKYLQLFPNSFGPTTWRSFTREQFTQPKVQSTESTLNAKCSINRRAFWKCSINRKENCKCSFNRKPWEGKKTSNPICSINRKVFWKCSVNRKENFKCSFNRKPWEGVFNSCLHI